MNFNDVIFETGCATLSQLPESNMPEICFSGRSNVGKSSLINTLLGRKSIARVSSTPGKTITINFYKTKDVRFVDLPGYGFAKRNDKEKLRFSELTQGYFSTERNIKLCLQLIDMRHSPTADDMQMLEFLCHYGINFAVVLTKCDKLNKAEFNARLTAFKAETERFTAGVPAVPFSSLKKTGCETLKEIIENSIF